MNLPAAKIVLLLFFLCLGMEAFAQRPCPPGQAPCGPDNTCKERRECGGAPPPPGLVLPIDSNIYFLMAAGLGLGIYFMQRRPKTA